MYTGSLGPSIDVVGSDLVEKLMKTTQIRIVSIPISCEVFRTALKNKKSRNATKKACEACTV